MNNTGAYFIIHDRVSGGLARLRHAVRLFAVSIMGAGFCALPAFAAPDIAATPLDPSSAVIFSYQRVNEDLNPDTSIRADQFAEHVQELMDGEYNIVPLEKITTALQKNERLPPRTVALTFNGAYKSSYENAMPLLLKHDIPFTIFLPTDHMDAGMPQTMSWDDVRKLHRNKIVSFGLHPASYVRLNEANDAEIRRQINNSIIRFRDVFKKDPVFFAYPFGEYTLDYRNIVAESGFAAAFGQQSGVAYAGADMFSLPRFSMTENYGGLDRFRMAATALPFPVSDVTPENPYITDEHPPIIGFTIVPDMVARVSDISCFISGQNQPDMKIVGSEKNRIELRMNDAITDERIRVNCTAPGPIPVVGDEQQWRWFGML